MAVYIIMTIISMLFAGYAQNVKEVESLDSTYRILGVMAFLPFAVVSALRYQVGTDWPIYNDYFHSIPAGGKKFTEPLFNLLNRFLYHFTQNSYILFAVVAVLLLSFMFLTIFQQSEYLTLSILIFVVSGDFFNSQNQIRQMLATAILLYALNMSMTETGSTIFYCYSLQRESISAHCCLYRYILAMEKGSRSKSRSLPT